MAGDGPSATTSNSIRSSRSSLRHGSTTLAAPHELSSCGAERWPHVHARRSAQSTGRALVVQRRALRRDGTLRGCTFFLQMGRPDEWWATVPYIKLILKQIPNVSQTHHKMENDGIIPLSIDTDIDRIVNGWRVVQ